MLFSTLQNSKDEDRALVLLDSAPSASARALRLDRMTLTHPGAMLDEPREFRRSETPPHRLDVTAANQSS